MKRKKKAKTKLKVDVTLPMRVGQRAFFSLSTATHLAPHTARAVLGKYSILLYFLCEFWKKVQFFNPNQEGNMPVNRTSST